MSWWQQGGDGGWSSAAPAHLAAVPAGPPQPRPCSCLPNQGLWSPCAHGEGGLPAGGRQILFSHKLLLALGSVGRTRPCPVRPRPFCVNGLTRRNLQPSLTLFLSFRSSSQGGGEGRAPSILTTLSSPCLSLQQRVWRSCSTKRSSHPGTCPSPSSGGLPAFTTQLSGLKLSLGLAPVAGEGRGFLPP